MRAIVVEKIDALRQVVRGWRALGLRVGFVPTMGYLHEGHLSLIDKAHEKSDRVVVSIFVNPTQFGPEEDLERYPRDPEGDQQKAEEAGADLLFFPSVEAIYPPQHQTYVEVKEVTQGLCGSSRPTHFRGVTTVVAKLFLLVEPHVAVFGEKDFQQLVAIRQMVRDLHFDVEIVGGDIVREEGGLALSSRNVYLTPEQREAALRLNQSLRQARRLFAAGERDPQALHAAVLQHLQAAPGAQIDYAELRDPHRLQPVTSRQATGEDRFFLAVRFGATRLIDNAPLAGPSSLD